MSTRKMLIRTLPAELRRRATVSSASFPRPAWTWTSARFSPYSMAEGKKSYSARYRSTARFHFAARDSPAGFDEKLLLATEAGSALVGEARLAFLVRLPPQAPECLGKGGVREREVRIGPRRLLEERARPERIEEAKAGEALRVRPRRGGVHGKGSVRLRLRRRVERACAEPRPQLRPGPRDQREDGCLRSGLRVGGDDLAGTGVLDVDVEPQRLLAVAQRE